MLSGCSWEWPSFSYFIVRNYRGCLNNTDVNESFGKENREENEGRKMGKGAGEALVTKWSAC